RFRRDARAVPPGSRPAGLLAWRMPPRLRQTLMSSHHPVSTSSAPKAWWHLSQTKQILLGLVLGTVLGWGINVSGWTPATKGHWNDWLVLGRDTFLHLIKAMIAPLVFASVVQGIAGTG